MHVIHHRTRQRWEREDRWNLIAQHETLARCVEGIERIVAKTMGDGRGRLVEDYQIVHLSEEGWPLAIYDAHGRVVWKHTVVAKTRTPKRQLVAV